MADSEQARIFDEYETTILDTFHTIYRLWREDRAPALFATLAQFDISAAAEIAVTPMFAVSPFGLSQAIKGQEEGLSQAVR